MNDSVVVDSGGGTDGAIDDTGGGDGGGIDTAPPPETAWTKTTVPGGLSVVSVHGTGPDDVWAMGLMTKGTIVHWDGTAWTVSQALDAPGRAVWAISKTDAWALSEQPGVAWRWNGSTWTKHSSFSVTSVYALWGSAADDVWLGSQSNFSQKPTRHFNGTTWSMVDTGSDEGVHYLWGSGKNDVWGSGVSLLHWDGSKWNSVEPGSKIGALGGSAKNDVWGVGAAGLIRHYDGASWSDSTSGTTSDLRAVWAASATDAWAGGYSNLLHWDGTKWSDGSTKAGAPKNASVIAGTSSTDVWVASGSDVYHLAPK